MTYSRKSVLELSPDEKAKLNEKRCPICDHDLQVTILGNVPQVWTCDHCRTQFSTIG